MRWKSSLGPGLTGLIMAGGLFAGAVDAAAQEAGGTVSRYQEEKYNANLNTVTIMAGTVGSPYTVFAEDLRNVLDEPETGGLRVLTLLGRGGGQNMLDVLFLKNVDMGFIDLDAIAYFKKQDPVLHANLENRVHYIAKIANAEANIIVRPEIKTIEDLRGKPVGFFHRYSSSAIGAENIFSLAGVDVEPVYVPQPTAHKMMQEGKLFGAVRFGFPPHNAFVKETVVKKEDNFHFLPLSPETMSPGAYERLLSVYLPSVLKHEHYPEIIPEGGSVPTVANGTLLASYAWEPGGDRYRKVAHFIKKMFDNFDKLREEPRSKKWQDVNLATEVPGWRRFRAAQEWLDAQKTASVEGGELKTAFEKFIKDYSAAAGGQPLSNAQREALFTQFSKWWETQGASRVRQ